MDIISIKLNLTKLPKSAIVKRGEKEFIVLNIDDTRLFKSEKGNVFLDLVAIPFKEKKYEDDYFVAESVTQDERKAGTQGEIIGNARILGGGGEQAPSGDQATENAFAPPTGGEENDDLPF